MRFQVLGTVFFSLFVVSLCSLEAHGYIRDLIDGFNIKADEKNFNAIGKLFVPNSTYDAGNGPVKGVEATKAILAKILNPGTVTQFATSTQIIEQLPPFDPTGSPSNAKSLTYVTVTFFGTGDLKGEIRVVFAKYVDELVKTGDFALFGGWRFISRKFEQFGPAIGNKSIEL